MESRAVATALIALAALAPGLASAALPPGILPLSPDVNPLANGGFEACLERSVATFAHLPEAWYGRVSCAPWVMRTGTADATGALPRSTSGGVLIGDEGRRGVLRITYDTRDGVLLLSQETSAEGASAWADPERVLVTLRSDYPALVGFHVLAESEDRVVRKVPASGSPVFVGGANLWRTLDLEFPAGTGQIRAAALEVHSATQDGAVIEVDAIEIDGAVIRPRVTR